jgi:phosphohistidine phosphatase
MRRLILMRHAKSDWDSAASDHDRPLNARGRRDAPRVGARIADLGWEPERVVLSDSQRTSETWARMAGRFTVEPEVIPTRSLYLSGFGALQREIEATPDHVRTLLALGHNPDWESAVAYFVGRSVPITTANAALITLPDEPWESVVRRPAVGQLLTVLRPKEIGEDA